MTNRSANPLVRKDERVAWRRRLASSGRLLVAMAAVTAVLVAADLASLLGGLGVLLGLILAVLLVPPPDEVDGRVEVIRGETDANLLLPGARRLAQSLPDPCFILARDGMVLFANDRAVETFGIKAGELLLLRLRYPEFVTAFGRVTRGKGPQIVRLEERVPTERSFSAWISPLDQGGADEFYLLVLDDLTELRATERMRADFVANASHELRTPLASLFGFIETLQGPAREDAEARTRFLDMMHEQALRMRRLIDDLLSLSRIEMSGHMAPTGSVELVELLGHVIDTMGPLAQELGVSIDSDLPSNGGRVVGDRDELVQVFNNLVENACKYGQSGGRIVVRLLEEGDSIAVSVIDFGPGIASEHLPRLTERFYRIDADESRRHRGTGLGLAIVKHIAGRHRARLKIESQPDQGATFTLLFPAAKEPSGSPKIDIQ